MTKVAIFASGSGTNAENIIRYFKDSDKIEVNLVLTNNPTAGVIERARKLNIPTLIFNKVNFTKTESVLNILKGLDIDWVILAGFLWQVPQNLISAFPEKIINIHPALLPNFGGKGMWGHHVHEAVIESKVTESGISIHYVNENYDEGKIIFQAKCPVEELDTPEKVAEKVHALEYKYFPLIIEREILKNL